jgi:hypothetical protein
MSAVHQKLLIGLKTTSLESVEEKQNGSPIISPSHHPIIPLEMLAKKKMLPPADLSDRRNHLYGVVGVVLHLHRETYRAMPTELCA